MVDTYFTILYAAVDKLRTGIRICLGEETLGRVSSLLCEENEVAEACASEGNHRFRSGASLFCCLYPVQLVHVKICSARINTILGLKGRSNRSIYSVLSRICHRCMGGCPMASYLLSRQSPALIKLYVAS